MTISVLYLLVGIIIGILIKYEIDIKAKKKRLEKRETYLKATAKDDSMKQYDDILASVKGINKSLSKMQK